MVQYRTVANLDDLRGSFADGVQQGLLDAFELEPVEQEIDRLEVLTVDGQMEGTPSHVVDAVDVQRTVAFFQGLTDDRDVAQGGRVQVDALLVRQLFTGTTTDIYRATKNTHRTARDRTVEAMLVRDNSAID